MKINNKEFAQIITDRPQNKTLLNKIKCPSPKKLTALLRSELSGRKRSHVMGHLANCSTCAREIIFINDLLKAEKNFDRKAAQVIAERHPTPSKKIPSVRSPFPQFSWNRGVFATAAAFILVLSTIFLLVLPNKPAIERSAILQLEQISPNDISLSLNELVFQWKDISASDYYTVEIFDDSLSLVWRSERMTENKIIPSAELKQRLKPKATYCWMVTSFFKNGKHVESPMAKFNLE